MNPTQPTQEQLNARIQDSGQTPVPQSAPPVSSTMQPEKFSQTPFQTPETPTQPDYMAAFSSIPTIEQVQQATDSMVSAQTPAEKTQNTIADRLLAGYQKLTGKAGAQIKAEESAGLPQFNQQLNDINGQIKQLQATALANQEKALNSGETSSFAAGEAQRVGRNDAIKAMSLSAIASTLQGNIALAQQTADRAVELEFAPAQAEIDFLSKAYELNKDSLSREDKKRAETLQIQLVERQRLLDEQKDDKKTIIGFSAEAAKNGAPTLLINRAQAVKTPTEALEILAQYMSDPMEKQQAILQEQLLREQIKTQQNNRYIAGEELKLKRSPVPSPKEAKEILEETKAQSDADLKKQEVISLAQELRKSDATGKGSAVGSSIAKFVPFGKALGLQGNRAAFDAKVNTLKSNLTLDNLKLLKGAMSDKDLVFLNSIGSSLDTDMTEAEFDKELDKVIGKLAGEEIVKDGITYKKGPDGLYYAK